MWRRQFPYRYLPTQVLDWLDPRLEDANFYAQLGAAVGVAGLFIIALANFFLAPAKSCSFDGGVCSTAFSPLQFLFIVGGFVLFGMSGLAFFHYYQLRHQDPR